MSPVQAAPTRFKDILRQLGPGLIITGAIVGSGELIVTPKLGADVGFTLLWFIIIGCLIKVFVQVELGRYAIARGMTTLEAMNTIPGPRFIVSWLLWIWLLMYVALVFQVAGIVGGVATIFALGGSGLSSNAWAFMVVGSCILLLVAGRYRLVESASAVMVAVFTLCTVVAVGALQWTPYAVTGAQIAEGLSFRLPTNFNTAFAAFGIIGVGASELIYYPYWCLEKGYGRYTGVRDNSPEWRHRAQGWMRVMTIDALVSLVIYTGATIAFYLLGAAVLFGKGLAVSNANMIETLSHMYRETFGTWGLWIFLIGGFIVLYSTLFAATASNARLFADALSLFRLVDYRSPEHRVRMIKLGCVLLPIASLILFLIWGAPVTLVFVGAVAQGIMLPFLAAAAVYFRFQEKDPELRPGGVWTFFLGVAAVSMAAAGVYQVTEQIGKLLAR
jgi:manganese transport protein